MSKPANQPPSFKNKLSTILLSLLFLGGLIMLVLSNRLIAASNQTSTDIDANHYVEIKPIVFDDSYTVKKHYVGLIQAQQESQLSFQSVGKIEKLYVDDGETIRKGQLLAQLNTETLQAQRKELQAKLDLAEIKLKLAKKNYERVATATSKNAYSEQQEDEALSTLKIAETEISITQSQLQQLSIAIENTRIIAPYDGLVTKRLLDAGNTVHAGQTVFSIQTTSNYEARIGIPGQALKHLEIGKNYQLNNEESIYPATLISINNNQKYNELIEVSFQLKQETEKKLYSGDLIYFSLPQTVQQKGLWVNIENLSEATHGLWRVFIAQESKENNQFIVSPRAVEIIYSNSQQAFITGSFMEGEKLIIKGTKKLVPQQKIKIR